MIDTGAFANALPQNLIDELKEKSVEILYSKPEYSTVKLASGAPLPINSQAEIKFKIGHLEFSEVLGSTKNEQHNFGSSIFQKTLDRNLANGELAEVP